MKFTVILMYKSTSDVHSSSDVMFLDVLNKNSPYDDVININSMTWYLSLTWYLVVPKYRECLHINIQSKRFFISRNIVV